jgi:4-hydroxybenzoate polyprenyltransferase
LLAFIQLWLPSGIVPEGANDFVGYFLGFLGVGAGSALNLFEVFALVFVFLNVVTIAYAMVYRRRDLEDVERDDGTFGARAYLWLLDAVVWEVYLATLSMIGLMVGGFSPLALRGGYGQAGVWGIAFAYSLSALSGWGRPKKAVRKSKTANMPAQDPGQERISGYV